MSASFVSKTVSLPLTQMQWLTEKFGNVTKGLQHIVYDKMETEIMDTLTAKNGSEVNLVEEEQDEKVNYDEEETRYLEEFNLTEDEKEAADEEVGQIMDEIYDRLEQHYVEEYFDRLRAKTEKERYIGRRLELLQIESFGHFCGMSQGLMVGSMGYPKPELGFPFKRL